MKKVIIILAILLLGYFGYKSFLIPNNEQLLENTLKQMDTLDTQDTINNVSEEDLSVDNKTEAESKTTSAETVSSQTNTSIDLILTDIANFNGSESSDPFEGL